MDYNEQTQRYNVGVTAIVRVTLRDGVHHEDVGYGVMENAKQKGPALDKVWCPGASTHQVQSDVLTVAVQEGSRHRRRETSASQLWKRPGELPLR